MNISKLGCVLLIGAVSACGSSSSSTDEDEMTKPKPGESIAIFDAPGAGGGSISNSTAATAIAKGEEVEDAIANGSLMQAMLPETGSAMMTGFVGTQGDTEDDAIIGNLTIDVAFIDGAVVANGSDFTLYDVSNKSNPTAVGNFGGTLTGTGTASTGALTSSLDGTLTSAQGAIVVDSTLSGKIYDNGGDYVAQGSVTGTLNGAAGTVDGTFLATE